jgi:hypothetical protein
MSKPESMGYSTLSRPKFAPGMLLQHDDLEQLSSYTRDLSRLLFRSLLGCGVVCGLVVSGEEKCGKLMITVGAGLALDCNGDPIEVPKDHTLPAGDGCDTLPEQFWVVVCARTKSCAPRMAMCASDDDEPVSACTRERVRYEIQLLDAPPTCACGCTLPKKTPDNLTTNDKKQDADQKTGGNQKNGDDCVCATLECHAAHYAGECGCADDNCDCGCDCVVLARLSKPKTGKNWDTDHSVRRFIRPVLMRDPQVVKERSKTSPDSKSATEEPENEQAALLPAPTKSKPKKTN